MRLIDLSHPIAENMPVYPGTAPPVIVEACRIEDCGFEEKRMTLFSHTGTHVDAPAHILAAAKPLDQLPLESFYGHACRVDVTGVSRRIIEIDDLSPRQNVIANTDFVLLHTGWSRFWTLDTYLQAYPTLSVEAARWLCGFNLKGVGIDTISMDAAGSAAFPVHHVILERDMIIVENLTNLASLPNTNFLFSCLPLNIADADGSPVRAVGIVN